MARVKVKVERGNGLQQVVVIDTGATEGATVGSNLYLNGAVATPATLSQWLGITPGGVANIRSGYGILVSGNNPKTVNVNRSAAFAWQGQHQWEQALWGPNGSNAAPAFTFTSDPDTGVYRVGANNLGIATGNTLRWDVNTTRARQSVYHVIDMEVPDSTTQPLFQILVSNPGATDLGAVEFTAITTTGTFPLAIRNGWWDVYPGGAGARGFQWLMPASGGSAAQFRFYTHHNSDAGTEVFRAVGNRAQLQFVSGTASVPPVSFVGSTSSGLYSPATNQIGVTIAGTQRAVFYSAGLDVIGYVGASNGSAGAPSFSWFSDQDNGIYYITTNSFGVATAGALRFQFGAAGQFGIGGATYGTANTQAIVSGGASAAPSWQTVLVDGQTQTLGGAKTWSANARFNGQIGFNNTAPIAQPIVSGSRADPEAALANLLTALANYGLITNSTTA